MKLYLCVTRDKYELPLAVAESQQELADMVGVQKNTIASALCKYRRGWSGWSIYHEVEVDDD